MKSLRGPPMLLNNSGHSRLQTAAACSSRLVLLSPLCFTGLIYYPWCNCTCCCTCCTVCNTVVPRSLTQGCGLANDGEMTPLFMILCSIFLNKVQTWGEWNEVKSRSPTWMKWQDGVGGLFCRLNLVGNNLRLLFSVPCCSRTCGLWQSPCQQGSSQRQSLGKI